MSLFLTCDLTLTWEHGRRPWRPGQASEVQKAKLDRLTTRTKTPLGRVSSHLNGCCPSHDESPMCESWCFHRFFVAVAEGLSSHPDEGIFAKVTSKGNLTPKML